MLRHATLVSAFDRFVVPPLLLAMAADLGVSLGQAAAAATSYYLLYGTLQPVWGLVSDRVGRVRLMRGTLLLNVAVGSAAAFAPTLWSLVALRGLTAALSAAVIPAALTYVGDTVPIARRQRALVDIMTGTYSGAILASILGGLAAGTGLWRIGLLLPALGGGVMVVRLGRLVDAARPTTPAGPRTVVAALRHPWTLLVIALVLLEGAIVQGILTYIPAGLETAGASTYVAGASVAVFGVGVLAGNAVLRRQVAHRTAATLLGIGGACIAIGFAGAASADARGLSPTALVVAIAAASLLLGTGFATMHTTLQTWATEVFPEARATVISLFAGGLFAGSALATAAASGTADAGRFDVLFLVAGVAAVPVTAVAVVLRRRYDARPATGPEPRVGP